jgi:hypothetical protein
MVTDDAGHPIAKKKKEQISKKGFCLSLDDNCSKIEIQRKKMDQFQRDKTIKISSDILQTIQTLSNTINTINTTMAKINNDIQENRQQYVPPQPAQEQPMPALCTLLQLSKS